MVKTVSKNKIDFTKGQIFPLLITFAIPLILSELCQNFYNSVDTLVVGNLIGNESLAAVSVCSTISQLVIGFFTGMSIGVSVVVARFFGKQDSKQFISSVISSIKFAFISGFALSVMGVILTNSLLKISNVPESIYNEAHNYLSIFLAGAVFTVVYNIGSGILRAIGDTVNPFKILLITGALNVVLDLGFTLLGLGVRGVALATVLSQATSVVLVLRTVKKQIPEVEIKETINWKMVGEVCSIGIPSAVQNILISFSNLFVWRYVGMFNSPSAISGIGVAQRLDKFTALTAKAFGHASTTFVSQNMGCGNKERAKKGAICSFVLGFISVYLIGIPLLIWAPKAVSLFNRNIEVINVGSTMMRTLIPFYSVMALREVLLGFLRGNKKALTPMILSLMGMVVARQVFLFFRIKTHFTLNTIYQCYPFAWVSTALFLSIYTFFFLLKEKSKVSNSQNN